MNYHLSAIRNFECLQALTWTEVACEIRNDLGLLWNLYAIDQPIFLTVYIIGTNFSSS